MYTQQTTDSVACAQIPFYGWTNEGNRKLFSLEKECKVPHFKENLTLQGNEGKYIHYISRGAWQCERWRVSYLEYKSQVY